MSADKSHQIVIREAIRKIALGRSMERVNMAPQIPKSEVLYLAATYNSHCEVICLSNLCLISWLTMDDRANISCANHKIDYR